MTLFKIILLISLKLRNLQPTCCSSRVEQDKHRVGREGPMGVEGRALCGYHVENV